MTPLVTPSQAITEGAAAEPAVTRMPRATTPRVWVTVTETASGRTSLIVALPRAAAVAAMIVLPWPGARACIAPSSTAMPRASAAKPRVRSWRDTRSSSARVKRSAPRGRMEEPGASEFSSTSAGPPGRTRSDAVAVSAGDDSNSLGYLVSSPETDFVGTSEAASVIRSPRAVISRQPGPVVHGGAEARDTFFSASRAAGPSDGTPRGGC